MCSRATVPATGLRVGQPPRRSRSSLHHHRRGNTCKRRREKSSQGTCKASGGGESKVVEFRVPSDLPPTSIQANRLITISYFFKLDLEHFDVVIPVVVGTAKTPGPLDET